MGETTSQRLIDRATPPLCDPGLNRASMPDPSSQRFARLALPRQRCREIGLLDDDRFRIEVRANHMLPDYSRSPLRVQGLWRGWPRPPYADTWEGGTVHGLLHESGTPDVWVSHRAQSLTATAEGKQPVGGGARYGFGLRRIRAAWASSVRSVPGA